MKTKKILLMALAALLLVAVSVGGTVAYLTATSGPVTNTFTPSSVGVTLTESENTYKMVPGVNLAKDPKVTVTNDIPVYVFVEITENNWSDFLTYGPADGWAVVVDNETSKVWAREVAADAAVKEFYVLAGTGTGELANGQVVVSADMDMTYMSGLAANPQLIFNAYVIQKDPFTSAADAWAQAK